MEIKVKKRGTSHSDQERLLKGITKTKLISVELPESTKNRLKAKAAKEGKTVKAVISGFVEDYLAD